MKVDLVYPKIPENSDKFHGKCIAFEKYDGTNLHWKWNRQDGWYVFGTRRTQFPLNRVGIAEFSKEHSELADAPHIFNDSLRDKLSMYFPQHHMFSGFNITLFTEFYGPNSFAGGHVEEEHQLVIIDVMQNNKLLAPETFHEFFHEFGSAQVVYTGKYSGQFAEDVRKGKYDINEGVVVKGVVDGEVFMTKVKTNDYLKRLRKR
jgi:RNA ligase